MSSYIYEVIRTDPDIPVKCFTYHDPIGFLVPAHWHNSIEILQIQKGRMNITLGERAVSLDAGWFLIVNSREIHSTSCERGTTAEVVQIPIPFLRKYLPGIDGRHFYSSPFNALSSSHRLVKKNREDTAVRISFLVNELNCLNLEREEAFLALFHSRLFELIYLMYTNCSTALPDSVVRQDDMNRERLTKVMNYVNENYKEHISLERAASLVALNKEYFCRFFRKNMGMSLVDYVNEVRFSHVCEDLFESRRNIITILEENGFTNYKLFMKMFRSRYHTTPSRKRKEVISRTQM